MTSAAPSPCLALLAPLGAAETPGSTGQTLRRVGRFAPSSAPPFPGRGRDQVVGAASCCSALTFPAGAEAFAPPSIRAGGRFILTGASC